MTTRTNTQSVNSLVKSVACIAAGAAIAPKSNAAIVLASSGGESATGSDYLNFSLTFDSGSPVLNITTSAPTSCTGFSVFFDPGCGGLLYAFGFDCVSQIYRMGCDSFFTDPTVENTILDDTSDWTNNAALYGASAGETYTFGWRLSADGTSDNYHYGWSTVTTGSITNDSTAFNTTVNGSITLGATTVPEPSGVALLALGGMGIIMQRKRRNQCA